MQYFPGVSALRGIAALLVVVQHAGYFAATATRTPYSEVIKVDFGLIGVVMFFTISGFVIGLNRHLPTVEFATRRALRIYPAFWIAYALSAVAAIAVGQPTGFKWFAALLLPSFGYPAMQLPVWTLVFEVFFYMLAAIVFALRLSDRALTWSCIFWILAILAASPYTGGKLLATPGAVIPLAQFNLFFALGLLCALNIDLLSRASAVHCLGVAIVAIALLPFFPALPHVSALIVLGIGLSAILIAATQFDKWPRLAVRLGDASYGLFLVHFAAMMVATDMLAAGSPSVWWLFWALIAAGLVIGIPFGLAEFAMHRMALRRLLPRRIARVPGVAH
ncbi:MAG TPA: acyltransferase [Xanthobacteraceae bacterium]|nr:acyltransferase [Xanthobacteraceae bacterium]